MRAMGVVSSWSGWMWTDCRKWTVSDELRKESESRSNMLNISRIFSSFVQLTAPSGAIATKKTTLLRLVRMYIE